MKRHVSALLLALNLSFLPFTASAQLYSDIAKTRYNAAFLYLQGMGVAKGYDDGTARPWVGVNRAEALKMVLADNEKYHARVQWHREHPTSLALFKDVQTTAWYSPLVETAFETGLVKGYGDSTFRPGGNVRLSEALTMIFRAQSVSVPQTDPWYVGTMQKAKEKNLLSSQEQWDAAQYLSRGQLMDIVYRSSKVRREAMVAFVDAPVPQYAYVPSNTSYVPRATTYTPPRATTSAVPSTAPGSTAVRVMQFTISIPSLGISNMLVTHPSDPNNPQSQLSVLKNGVGHLFSFPGTNGKIVVYGHSSSYSWDSSAFTKIFRTVNQLKAGDTITISYAGKQYTYEVTYQEQVHPKDTSRYSGTGEELLLYTCWPPDTIDKRLIVHAKPVGTVAQR